MDRFLKYLLTGIIFWIAVDFTTAFNPDIQRWIAHMPLIWAFYIGYPLIFAYLIYKGKFEGRKLFYAMTIGMLMVEIVFSSNALMYTFPMMLFAIPIAFFIYGLVTYAPMWIVDKKVKKNKRLMIIFIIVWLIVSVMNYATQIQQM